MSISSHEAISQATKLQRMTLLYILNSTPPSADYVKVSRWYNHIEGLLRMSGVSGEGQGVKVEGSATVFEGAPASPPVVDTKAPAADDDDDDVDLFGEETEEEKNAAEERAAAMKASGKKKESGKSSVLLDVKPWDDETDMQKLEEAVRNVKMEGLFWGASKLVPAGYGIKKLQIMMTILDDLVSVDNLIEDHLTSEPANEHIQSCDIVAFNKICEKVISTVMATTFHNLNSASGLEKLDEYLLPRSCITGYQASKDDIAVHFELSTPPSADYVNVSRWYNHIEALLRMTDVSGRDKA